MKQEGILKIKRSKVFIKAGKKKHQVPSIFAVNESHLGSCEFVMENNQVISIFKDSKPIPRDAAKLKEKDDRNKRKEERAKFDKERDAAIQKEAQSTIKDIFKIKETRLPKEIRDSGIWDVDNFYLKFHKYAAFRKFDKKEEFKLFFTDKKNTYKIKNNFKNQEPLIKQVYEDQHQAAAKLHGEGYFATDDLEIDWRLVVGLGGASVYETSITLHHLYGFPYIPASGVKGMVNAYVHTQIADYEEKEKDKNDIFGSKKEAGKIIFYDALPTEAPTIKSDVMNPHYTPYYQPKNTTEYPADYHKPVPVNFLSVTDTTFRFTIGVCKGKHIEENERKDLLKKAYQWLKEALEEQGIGAKTAVGYGYMGT